MRLQDKILLLAGRPCGFLLQCPPRTAVDQTAASLVDGGILRTVGAPMRRHYVERYDEGPDWYLNYRRRFRAVEVDLGNYAYDYHPSARTRNRWRKHWNKRAVRLLEPAETGWQILVARSCAVAAAKRWTKADD